MTRYFANCLIVLRQKKARYLLHSVHIAAAQILFMDVPDSAAVDLAVTAILENKTSSRFSGLANAVLRRLSREKDGRLKAASEAGPFPKWLERRIGKDYGKSKAGLIGDMVRRKAPLDISVKSDPSLWAERLNGIVLPTGSVRLKSDKPVHTLEGFDDGEWWVQDAAAAIPAHLMACEKGSRILELCAAPGGKTAQLLSIGYQVTALDISVPRLSRLRENMSRLGFEPETVQADMLEWQPDELFDGVLLDAPCSSTGTVRRHPDVLWTRSEAEIRELAALQEKLLLRAIEFVKPGGKLVFSNCSLMKEEGEDILARVAKGRDGFEVSKITAEEVFGIDEIINGQGAVRSLPFHFGDLDTPEIGGMDGFFACRFSRAV